MPALFTNPPVVLTPASPFLLVDARLPFFYGPRRNGGAVWGIGDNFGGAFSGLIAPYKSIDGGATWVLQDQANAPTDINSNHGYTDFMADGATLHILGKDTTGVNPKMVYCPFDMGTGLFGTSINSGLINGFWKIAIYNGNPIAIYSHNNGIASLGLPLRYSIISSGAFGTPVDLVAGTASQFYAPLSTILDTSGTLHVIYSRSNSPTQLWHVALDSGGGVSTPDQVDAAAGGGGNPYSMGQGLFWSGRLLWATNEGAQVVLYDGTPSTGPTWTKRTVATLSPSSAGNSFQAHVVLSGTDVYIFWYYNVWPGAPQTSQVQYSIFDGSTFTSPQVAYDEYANPPAGDPGASGGSNLDSFSIVPVAGGGFDMMALAFVTAGFDQGLVFLTNASTGKYRQRLY